MNKNKTSYMTLAHISQKIPKGGLRGVGHRKPLLEAFTHSLIGDLLNTHRHKAEMKCSTEKKRNNPNVDNFFFFKRNCCIDRKDD